MPRAKVLFTSVNLIGDTITQTPAIRAYKRLNPECEVTWGLQSQNQSLFALMPNVEVCDKVFFDDDWDRLRERRFEGYDEVRYMRCDEAFSLGAAHKIHMAQAYGKMIGVEILEKEILPVVPIATPDSSVGVPSRTMVISPRSASNNFQIGDGFSGNKNAPWSTWVQLAKLFREANRIDGALFLLGPEDPAPPVDISSIRLPLGIVPWFIAKACAQGGLYAGVDNGITHIAAGLRVPCFVVYCEGIPESWVGYCGFSHYRIAKVNPAHARPVNIWSHWRDRLWGN